MNFLLDDHDLMMPEADGVEDEVECPVMPVARCREKSAENMRNCDNLHLLNIIIIYIAL